jgi:hypothetical protein
MPSSTINSSNQHGTKQIPCIYRRMLRLFHGFIFECGYDSGWNNAERKHR